MKIHKKLISFILIFAVLFTTVTYTLCLSTTASNVTVMYIDGDNVNVRNAPGLDGEKIDKIANTSAQVLDGPFSKDGFDWYYVSYNSGASNGYVAYDSSYIRLVTYDPDSVSQSVDVFPESYRPALTQLKALHPNWVFVPDAVNFSIDYVVYLESLDMRKQVNYKSDAVSWRSCGQGAFDWDTLSWILTDGGWTGASKEAVAYYMDPRNFFNSTDIFMFVQQSYDPATQNIEGVRSILSKTFMAKPYNDPNDNAYGGDYAAVIMEAAKRSGVSPYVIAGKLRQETAADSELISGTYPGYEGYYNYFNVQASGGGSDRATLIRNGLEYAKSHGWSSRSLAIFGGAEFLDNNYIGAGQDTYYYQDFNVKNVNRLWHQYAGNVADAYSKGRLASEGYKDLDCTLTFKIPVYLDMPQLNYPMPVKNGTANNYYLGTLTAQGLTPTFSMYNYDYNLRVNGDTAVKALPIQNSARIITPEEYSLNAGNNDVIITVLSESGYINSYCIHAYAEQPCKLYVNSNGFIPGYVPPNSVKGDTNGDRQITLRDLANIRLYLLGMIILDGDNYYSADTNGDGQIALRDLANVRLHLLGLINLYQ